jgi:hypothetical protein
MLVSMTVRCEQCGHESDMRYRFCGMCGAKLPPPPSSPPKPVAAKAPSEEPVRRVSGPSFLGLADEPTSSVSYLLEDELSESHWGRWLILVIILAGVGAAAWHWRSEVRAYVVARLAPRPSSNQSEQISSSESPTSTSGSEVAPGMPSANPAMEKPMTGVGDMPAAPPAAQTAAAPAGSPANNAVSSNEQPTTPSSATVPAQTQAQATPPATLPAVTPEQNESGETTSAKEEAPKAESAVTKRAKSEIKETAPAGSEADQLEARGEKYLYGTGVPVSCSRAQTDLQAAAEHGSTKADSVLGTMYATGHCVSRDLPLAYRWFARALRQDPSNARLQRDLQVLWNQMSVDERQVAMQR